jgi:hypothetical protein
VVPARDRQQRRVLLFASDFEWRYCVEQNPDVRFHESI